MPHADRPAGSPADTLESTTRRGPYQQPLPEQQSALSKWIVRIELTAGITVAIALLAYGVWRNIDFPRPVRIARMNPTLSIPPSAAHASFTDENVDVAKGQMLYMQACTSCHGQRGHGMPHQGVNLRESKFVESTNDRALVAFLKKGRPAMDPKNTTGLPMPPRGGNPSLDDDSLGHIVAFLRQVQKEQVAEKGTASAQEPTTRPLATVDQERASIDLAPREP